MNRKTNHQLNLNVKSQINIAWIFVSTVVTSLLVACGGSGSGGGSSDQPVAPQQNTPGYYDELVAKVVGDCARIDEMKFQSLVNLSSEKFGTSEDRKDLVVQVNLHLLQDGNYVAQYSEEKVIRISDLERQTVPLFSTTIRGQWSVEKDSKLILEGLGVANRLQVGNEKKAQLKIKARIHDARVNSLMIKLDKALGDFGPNGETAAELCSGN